MVKEKTLLTKLNSIAWPTETDMTFRKFNLCASTVSQKKLPKQAKKLYFK